MGVLQTIAEALIGVVVIVVVVPALIGSTILGCFGRGAAGEEGKGLERENQK